MINTEVKVGNTGKVYIHPSGVVMFEIENLAGLELELLIQSSQNLIKYGVRNITLDYDNGSIIITKDTIVSPKETFELLDIIEALRELNKSVQKYQGV